MSDNKLNLLVKFTGVDKLSGSIKNIVGASKAGTTSIRAMQKEVKLMEKDLKSVREQLSAGSMKGGLVMAERELAEAIARTNRQIDQQKTKLERIGNIQSKAGKVADFAGKAGAAATVAMTAPLIAFGQQAFRAAADAGELQSAFDFTFGKSAATMNAWAESTAVNLNRTTVEMKEAAKTFGLFFNQADPAKSAAMSQQFAVLAQDLSSFYNVDPGTALDKLRSGLTGESEPLRDFGVFMTEAAIKAQALKMGLKPLNGELSEQQKIMARAAFIMEKTKNAQGDLARTSGSTANQLRAANTAWQNMSLAVGQELIPALTPAILAFTDLIKGFSKLSPETRKWIVILGAGAAVIGPLLLGVAGLATTIGALAPVIVGIGSAFMAALPIIGGAITAIVATVGLPVILIGAALAAVAAVVYYYWDDIKAAFVAGWDKVKAFWSGLPSWMKSIGSLMMQGLLMALNPALLVGKLLGIAKTGMAAFKNYFGIKSPSRLFMEMGGHMTEGLGIGLDRGRGTPVRAVGRMAGAVAGAGAQALSPASGRASAAAEKVENNFYITQRPGESAEELAERIARILAKKPKSGGGSFEDDF